MSLFRRREKEAHFTMVGNQAARNPTLSLKAKGLLLLMLSFSGGWTYRLGHIGTLSSDGEHATKSALRELMDAGYVARNKNRSEDGTFQWIYLVDDEPFAASSETTPPFSTNGSSTDGRSSPKKTRARKSRKNNILSPAHAARSRIHQESLAQGQDSQDAFPVASPAGHSTPDGVAADAAAPIRPNPSPECQLPTRNDIEANSPEEGSAGAPRTVTDHQAMMTAIREALFPGAERCADRIEARLAAASKQLRSAGMDGSAPAGIVQHIRTQHAWRKYITPETLVEHSAEWASAQVNPSSTVLVLTGSGTQVRSAGRAHTTAEATQRSVDTATTVLAHIQNRRNQS